MKIVIKWFLTAILPLVMSFSPLANSIQSIRFLTGIFEGQQLVLFGSNFVPFESVEIEITDPLKGTINYVESAGENGAIEINITDSIAGTYKAVVLSGSATGITAETNVQGE